MPERIVPMTTTCLERLWVLACKVADDRKISLGALLEESLAHHLGKPKLMQKSRKIGRPRAIHVRTGTHVAKK